MKKFLVSSLALVTAVAGISLSSVAPAQAAATPSAAFCDSYSRDLFVGRKGEDVKMLQVALNNGGYKLADSSFGSPGNETTYFGSITRNAMSRFQADNNIAPTAGYFGPITRAKFQSLCSTTTPPTTGGGGTTTTTTSTAPITGNVSVVAGVNNGGSIISGASQVPVLNFKLVNGTNSSIDITGLKFNKTGVLSDANISNAYISNGNQIVAQYTGLSNGVISFDNTGIAVASGATADLTLRLDISTGTSNGNTISFALVGASDVMVSGGTVGGVFPINGGTFTTTNVSNPSLAQITSPVYQTVANTVDAGTSGFRSSALSLNVQNSPVDVKSLAYTLSGSVSQSDLKNFVLRIDGVQVAIAASVSSDSKVYFDLGSNPARLNTGSHQLEVYADVIGTPNRQFKLEILRPFDWILSDSQYNTNISGGTPSGTATNVLVRQGTATVSLSSSTPTGNIPLGGSSVTLAEFDIFAAGEGLRVKWLPFQITQSGSAASWATATNVDADIRNISLIADDGSQIGTTINTPSSCTYGTPVTTATTYSCSFGSPTSNVNYIIPANTSRKLMLRGDVQSTADVSTLKGSLVAPTGSFAGNNVEGQISFQTSMIPGGTIDGSTLSVSNTPFTGALNSAVSGQTQVPGVNQALIGSFSLAASTAEAINISSVSVRTTAAAGFQVQNLTAKVGSTPLNFTVPTVTNSTVYTFSAAGSPIMIPAGGNVIVDLYGDILTSSAVGAYNPVDLVGAVGNGASTNSNQVLKTGGGVVISTGAPVVGQVLNVAGAGTLNVSIDTSVPAAQQIVLGATGQTLGQFRFTADNNEDIRIDNFTATMTASAGAPATFSNLTVWDGATQVGTAQALAGAAPTFTTLVSPMTSNSMVIAKNETKTYTLKGDVASFSSSPTSHARDYSFGIAVIGDVSAFGQASSQASTIALSGPVTGNTQTTLRTKALVTLTALGTTTNRVRTAIDDVAQLSIAVDPTFGVDFDTVTLTFSGAAVATGGQTINLVDSDTNASVAAGVMPAAGGAVVLNLAPDFLITAGQTKNYKVRVDSSTFDNGASVSDSMSVQIAAPADFTYRAQGDATSINLEPTAVPSAATNATVSYE